MGGEEAKEPVAEGEAEAEVEVYERLTDNDIARLSDALLHNQQFSGPLEL